MATASRRACRYVSVVLIYAAGWGTVTPIYGQQYDSELRVASALVDDGDWNEAIDRLNAVLRSDRDNIYALYLRGIGRREAEKAHTMLTSSIEDFEQVLLQDSLYRDVLFQYALSLAYRNQYPEHRTHAIELTEHLLRQKPELIDVRTGLTDLYTLYIRGVGGRRATDWLRERDSGHALFFRAEVLRRDAVLFHHDRLSVNEFALREADKLYRSLLDGAAADPLRVSPIQILLARARVHYALDLPEEALALVKAAIDAVTDATDARLVFNDFKYVVTASEIDEFSRIQTPEAYQRFFRTMCTVRDPLPASRVNVRLAEHYRRLMRAEKEFLYQGFRAPFNAPDRFIGHRFPRSYSLASEFDDRGIIYIRHGAPDDIEAYVGEAFTSAESWRYLDPDLHFHFAAQEARGSSADFGPISGVGGYRLQTGPHPGVLPGILFWSSRYMGLSKDPDLVENLVERMTLDYMETGLTTDNHTWADEHTPINFPFSVAAFRGEDGRTDVNIYYGLPVGLIVERFRPATTAVEIEMGLAVHDSAWQSVATEIDPKRLAWNAAPDDVGVDVLSFTAGPDSYHVAVHARSLQDEHMIGAYRFDYRVPDLSGPGFTMSDLVPAFSVVSGRPAGRLTRSGLLIRANPYHQFSTDRPIHLYFELYGLSFGASDQTHYSTTITLQPIDERRGPLTLLRRRTSEPALSLRTTSEGSERSPAEHTEIDVSDVAPGKYELIVTVTDEHLGLSAVRSRTVELFAP